MRKYRIEERTYSGSLVSEYTPQYCDHKMDGEDIWEAFTDWVGVGVIIQRTYDYDQALLIIENDKRKETVSTIKYHNIK